MKEEIKKEGNCDHCEDYNYNLIECPENFEYVKRNISRQYHYCETCCKEIFDDKECFASCESKVIEDHKVKIVKDICESENFKLYDENSYISSKKNMMIGPNKFETKYEINPIFVESPVLVDEYVVFKDKDELYMYNKSEYEYLFNILKNKFKERPVHFLQSEKVTDTNKTALLKLEGEFVSGIIVPNNSRETKEKIKANYSEKVKNRKFTLQNVSVSKKEKDTIRIATVQLDFELTNSFPPELREKEKTIDKINRALEKANEKSIDIICFPELSFCEEWLGDIKQKYSSMLIIAGTYYHRNNNCCQILLDSDKTIPPQLKAEPSAFEEGTYTTKMISGESLNIYETRYGKFSVLICRDFPVHTHRLRSLVDVVFVPSYNDKIERFYSDAHTHVQNSPSYVIISNSSTYGGTSIFGIMHDEILKELVEAGLKIDNSDKYNLCEIEKGKEGIIFADFNIVHKSIQIPTPSNPEDVTNPVENITKILF